MVTLNVIVRLASQVSTVASWLIGALVVLVKMEADVLNMEQATTVTVPLAGLANFVMSKKFPVKLPLMRGVRLFQACAKMAVNVEMMEHLIPVIVQKDFGDHTVNMSLMNVPPTLV
jgi:hypothetical protein